MPTKSNTVRSPRLQNQYLFKDEHIVALFNLLSKRKMIKLLDCKRPEGVRKTNNPNYYLYYRIVSHHTKNYFILKDIIQALINAGTVQLKAKQKRSYN